MSYRKSSYAQEKSSNLLKALTIGTFMGAFTCVILMAILAIIFVKMRNIPQGIIIPLASMCSGIGSFCSGYIATRILKANGLIYGMLSGLLLFLIILISGVALSGENLTLLTLIKFFLMIISGGIGGVLGVNKRYKAR